MAKKPITVEVAGKERKVKFPVSAFIRLKHEHGIVLKDLQNDDKIQDVETIIAIIWAGLVTDDPTLTVEYLADNMELSELSDVAQTVMGAINVEGKKG